MNKEMDSGGLYAKRERDQQRYQVDLKITQEEAKRECERALLTLSSVGYPTPQEGYGADMGWAIRDLCRALTIATVDR
jgi:hypothetical protein